MKQNDLDADNQSSKISLLALQVGIEERCMPRGD